MQANQLLSTFSHPLSPTTAFEVWHHRPGKSGMSRSHPELTPGAGTNRQISSARPLFQQPFPRGCWCSRRLAFPRPGVPWERVRGGCSYVHEGTAAKAPGKAESTISRDIKRGRISAIRNADGSLAIDPAELHRVYPRLEQMNVAGNGISNDQQPPGTGIEGREIGLLRERIAEQAETIRDLRGRLDDAGEALRRSAEERRQLLAMIAGPRAPWWRRWFR